MRRREFITFITSAAMLPVAVSAQQPKAIPRIGYLSGNGNLSDRGPFLDAMLRGLKEYGYSEGQNLVIEYRGAEAKEDRIPRLIAELVELKPDILVVPTVWAAMQAAKEATKTIPIVLVTSKDPDLLPLNAPDFG